MTFEEFKNEWKQKGIELKFEKESHKIDGEELILRCKQKDDYRYFILITKTCSGFKLEPGFLADLDLCGYEIENGSVVSKNDLLIYTELIKGFIELTKDIKLAKGTTEQLPREIF